MSKSIKKRFLHWLRDSIAPTVFVLIYRIYYASLRPEFQGFGGPDELSDENGSLIFPLSHRDDVAGLGMTVNTNRYSFLVSLSDDGSFIANIMKKLGFGVVRGSSSRRSIGALKEMVSVVRSGKSIALIFDGPSGPLGVVKPGVITLAKLTGAPIAIMGIKATSFWELKSTWNKCNIPKPGAKVQIRFDRLITVPRNASKDEEETIRLEVEQSLKQIRRDIAA